jgi:hypothetical protein
MAEEEEEIAKLERMRDEKLAREAAERERRLEAEREKEAARMRAVEERLRAQEKLFQVCCGCCCLLWFCGWFVTLVV